MAYFSPNTLKSFFIVIIVLGISNVLMSQESTTSESERTFRKNEVKLNMTFALYGYFEGTYERLLNTKSSVGLVAGKRIWTDIDFNYHLFAYYRFFFGEQIEASGFFIEAHTSYWREDRRRSSGASEGRGIGIAVGAKFFRGKRLHGELLFGIGRTLKEDYLYEFENYYPRMGFLLGHRF